MPLYEYECPDCGAHTSVLYSRIALAQKAKVTCEACGRKPMRRVLSRVAFHRGRAADADSPQSDGQTKAAVDETPEALARTMRQAARRGDMGAEFNEVAARLEKGEQATSIEASLRKRKGQKMGPH